MSWNKLFDVHSFKTISFTYSYKTTPPEPTIVIEHLEGRWRQGPQHRNPTRNLMQEGKSKGRHGSPSSPDPGLIRLPGILNNMRKTMIVCGGWGISLTICVYHLHWLGQGKPWDCVFLPRPGRGKMEGLQCPKEKAPRTTSVNCLPPSCVENEQIESGARWGFGLTDPTHTYVWVVTSPQGKLAPPLPINQYGTPSPPSHQLEKPSEQRTLSLGSWPSWLFLSHGEVGWGGGEPWSAGLWPPSLLISY